MAALKPQRPFKEKIPVREALLPAPELNNFN